MAKMSGHTNSAGEIKIRGQQARKVLKCTVLHFVEFHAHVGRPPPGSIDNETPQMSAQ
jgi:hypothetical protein